MLHEVVAVSKITIKTSFSTIKLLVIFAILCALPLNTISALSDITLPQQFTVADGLVYEFGLYSIFYLIICPISIVVSYFVVSNDEIDRYILCRTSNRHSVILGKIVGLICVITVLFLVAAMLALIVCCFSMNRSFQWSELIIYNIISGGFILFDISFIELPPLVTILVQIFLLVLCCVSLGELLFLFSMLFTKKLLGIIFSLLLNFGLLTIQVMGLYSDMFPIWPFQNLFLSQLNVNRLFFAVSYWIIIISILTIINLFLYKRKDLIYESSENIG